MALNQSLLDQIRAALPLAVTPNLQSSSGASDLYEAYIWSLVIRAALSEGADISYWDVTGRRVVGNFHFRTSPGNIFSRTHPYSHARVSFSGCPDLEAHVGIYVAGKSRVPHECDVAVLFADEANFCRSERVHPRYSQVLLSVECKFYVQSMMGVSLARSFMGLTTEISRSNRFFVAVSESRTVESLFAHHHAGWETGVSPLDPKRRFTRLQGAFERAFRDYKAKNA
jgi:hypothetical protein